MNINEFRSELRFGGSRTSLFRVTMTNPVTQAADNKMSYMCKAASVPGSTINPIEAFYFGRPIKLSGNRTFEDWNVTVINDEDYLVRNALEAWANAINGLESNTREFGTSSPAEFKSTAEVEHIGQANNILKIYKFVGIWPSIISPIELDWANEAVAEFPVTFSFDYFVPLNPDRTEQNQ